MIEILKELKAQNIPIVGFVGTISNRAIDIELIQYLARNRLKYAFVFIGNDVNDVKSQWSESNIYVFNSVNKDEISCVIQLFDVGMIPYILTDQTMDYVFPRKVMEYLAAGKPVVSTDLKELTICKPYVSIANTKQEFCDCIDRALKKGIDQGYIDFVNQFDWSNLLLSLKNRLDQESCSHEIIYISSIRYDYMWHRQQEMMKMFSNMGYKILFVEPCHPSFSGKKMQQIHDDFWVLSLPGLRFERCLSWVNGINGKIQKESILKQMKELQFSQPIFWMDRIHGIDFSYFMKQYYSIYDLVDEILAFGRMKNEKMLIDLENCVLKHVDLLISSSNTLLKRKMVQSKRSGKNLFLPNGVDVSRFMKG